MITETYWSLKVGFIDSIMNCPVTVEFKASFNEFVKHECNKELYI